MKNLKFRAWDKRTKLMNDVTTIDLEQEIVFYHNWKYGHSKTIPFSDVILLQYTGLKDKNGVEIFEGDIIDKGYHNFSIENQIGCVEFNQGGDSDGWAHGDWLGWITNNYDSLLDVHEHCAVLGNKFEHPELLEE